MEVLKGILGLATIFLLVGIVYPTKLHHKIKLDKRWKSLVALVVLSVIAGPIVGGNDKSPSAAPANSTKTTTTTTTTNTNAKAEAKTAPASAPAPKAKQWTKIYETSGDQSNSPTDRFQLSGGDVKVVWEIKPENDLAKDMVVMGGSLNDSDNNEVDQFLANTGQKSGEWKIYGVSAGTYYFKPNSANGKWHITIYEMK